MSGAGRQAEAEQSEEWDAGRMGCGELLIELRKRLRNMPGGTIKLIALDPGAPEDIPSWCRMTNNPLLHHEPEMSAFWIRSRMEW